MGGKFSRDKGSRVERLLVDTLKDLKWDDVFRVPLSGASAGFKCDVVSSRNGRIVKFEVKARATGFDRFYRMIPKTGSDIAYVGLTLDGKGLIASYDVAQVVPGAGEKYLINADATAFPLKDVRALIKMQCLLGEAHVLVLKQDRLPFLFVRYI
jgi:hypothetical protein